MTVGFDAAPAPTSRRLRWIVAAMTVMTFGIGVAVIAFLASLPTVGDAELRVHRQLAAHGATDRAGHVPERIADSIIAVEDGAFRTNPGIDLRGVIRAILGGIKGGDDPGGSTITQQLAKALYGGNHGTRAKLKDLGLAVKLNERYSKDQIMEMYTSVEYFGHGAYGIDAAARTYFHKSAANLDWAEASMMAGLLQGPSRLDPIAHFGAARSRQRLVLDRLVATQTLTAKAADAAYAELSSLDR